MVSQSDILERPDVREGDTGNANEVFHYVKKNKIAESAVMGTHGRGAVRRGLPGHEGAEARQPGVPGLQGGLRAAPQGSTDPRSSRSRPEPRRASSASLAARRSRRRRSWRRRGAGQRAWMVALSSAPSSTAIPKKKQNSSAPIGVASAP